MHEPVRRAALPAWGVCNLGALNLGRFSRPTPDGDPFWPHLEGGAEATDEALARIDLGALAETSRAGTHFLDNVIDSDDLLLPRERGPAEE